MHTVFHITFLTSFCMGVLDAHMCREFNTLIIFSHLSVHWSPGHPFVQRFIPPSFSDTSQCMGVQDAYVHSFFQHFFNTFQCMGVLNSHMYSVFHTTFFIPFCMRVQDVHMYVQRAQYLQSLLTPLSALCGCPGLPQAHPSFQHLSGTFLTSFSAWES